MQKAFRPGRAASYHGPMLPVLGRLYFRACFFAHSNDCCNDLLVEVKPSGDDVGCWAAARPLHAKRTTVSAFWGFVIIGSSTHVHTGRQPWRTPDAVRLATSRTPDLFCLSSIMIRSEEN